MFFVIEKKKQRKFLAEKTYFFYLSYFSILVTSVRNIPQLAMLTLHHH